jgi:hypothetical protein
MKEWLVFQSDVSVFKLVKCLKFTYFTTVASYSCKLNTSTRMTSKCPIGFVQVQDEGMACISIIC